MTDISVLGQMIKKKHPEYADVPDVELGKRIKAKYPGSYDDFSDGEPNAGLSGPASVNAKQLIQPVNPVTGNKADVLPDTEGFKRAGTRELQADANALPAIGGMVAGIPGAAAGSLLKTATGPNNPTVSSAASDLGSDVITQGVIPAVAGKVLSGGVKAFSGSLLRKSPSVSNVLNAETNAAEEAGVNARNLANQSTRDANVSAAQEMIKPPELKLPSSLPDGIAKKTIGHDLYKAMNGEIPVNKVLDRAFTDINDLRQLKLLTGDVQGIEQAGINKVLNKGKIDPENVLRELKGDKSNIYNEAISPGTRQNIEDLMEILKEKSTIEVANLLPTDQSLISLAKGKMLLGVPAIGAAAMLGVPLTKMAGGVVLGEGFLNLAMRSPTLSKVIIQAAKTPTNAPAAGVLTKAIIQGLRGTDVIIKGLDGKDENAKIGPKGEFQYAQ